MGTIVTVIAGLALAGATTFGIVSAASDNPAGSSAPSSTITYSNSR